MVVVSEVSVLFVVHVVTVVVTVVVEPVQPVPTQTWFICPAVRLNGVLGLILSGSVVQAPLKVEVKTASFDPSPLQSVETVREPDNLVAVTT